jgi:hypothetical protein
MTEWQSLSIRRGLAEPDGPFEGIPRHLLRPLWQWSERYLGGETRGPARDMMLSKIANQLRIDTGNGFRGDPPLDGVLTAEAINGPDRFLDIVDFHLHLTGGVGAPELQEDLEIGGSVWRVADDGLSLERRLTETEHAAYALAVTPPNNEATTQLREAWRNAYGLHPDPSDSWDHSIKAVEALLWDLVIPKNNAATLGTIIKALEDKPANWTLRLQSSGQAHPVGTLSSMLRLMWPNPDRHGSGTTRAPTQQESEDVVRLAVMIVGWLRLGALTKLP